MADRVSEIQIRACHSMIQEGLRGAHRSHDLLSERGAALPVAAVSWTTSAWELILEAAEDDHDGVPNLDDLHAEMPRLVALASDVLPGLSWRSNGADGVARTYTFTVPTTAFDRGPRPLGDVVASVVGSVTRPEALPRQTARDALERLVDCLAADIEANGDRFLGLPTLDAYGAARALLRSPGRKR